MSQYCFERGNIRRILKCHCNCLNYTIPDEEDGYECPICNHCGNLNLADIREDLKDVELEREIMESRIRANDIEEEDDF